MDVAEGEKPRTVWKHRCPNVWLSHLLCGCETAFLHTWCIFGSVSWAYARVCVCVWLFGRFCSVFWPKVAWVRKYARFRFVFFSDAVCSVLLVVNQIIAWIIPFQLRHRNVKSQLDYVREMQKKTSSTMLWLWWFTRIVFRVNTSENTPVLFQRFSINQ